MISNQEIKRRLLGGKEPSKRLNRSKNSNKRIVNFYCGKDSDQFEINQPYTAIRESLPPPAPTFNSNIPIPPRQIVYDSTMPLSALYSRPEAPALDTNYKRPPKLEKAKAPTGELSRDALIMAEARAEIEKRRLRREALEKPAESTITEGSGFSYGGQSHYKPNSIMAMYMNRFCGQTQNPNSILGLYQRRYCEENPIQTVLNIITKNIRQEEKTEESNQHSIQQIPVIAKPLVKDYISSNPYSSTQLVPQTLQRPIAELLATSNAEHETETGEKYFIPIPPPSNTITKQNMPELALNTTPYKTQMTTDRENIIELNKALAGTDTKYVKSGISDLLSDIKNGKILKKPTAKAEIKSALNQFQINQVIQDKANQIRQQVETDEDQTPDEWDGSGLKSRYSVMKGYGFKGGCGYCKKQEKSKMDLFKTMQIRNLYGF